MDREDARFTAHALEGRISGSRALLEQLAASSLMRLSAIATAIERCIPPAERCPPARAAVDELMAICRKGGELADEPLDAARTADLEEFIASMWKLAAEPARPLNRAERRKQARIQLPRRERIAGRKPLVRVH